jgi:hypothetical protein
MAKDRAGPFSRKHRRYWMTVTGGMIFIMSVNVGLGLWLYDTTPRKLPVVRPVATPIDAGVDAPPGGGVATIDAGAPTAP